MTILKHLIANPVVVVNEAEEAWVATSTTGFVESLLPVAGLDWDVSDFSTLCRRQRTLNVSLPYRGSTDPLNILIDSTGIKAEGEGEWNARKHGGPKRRVWRKIHIPCLAVVCGANEEKGDCRGDIGGPGRRRGIRHAQMP